MEEKIFISYNHKDRCLIDMIARDLELEFGRDNIFYDVWSIQPGEDFIGKMNEGLESFKTFFFFVSQNSLESKMVSLEWQAALNIAIRNDLKFVAIKISDCQIPSILSSRLCIDLYGEGVKSAIEKMKCVVKSESTYEPLSDVQNLEARAILKDEKTISLIIEAKIYSEQSSRFVFAFSNEFNDFSICYNISETFTTSGRGIFTKDNGVVLNAYTVNIQRTITPGFPFISEIYLEKTNHIRDFEIYVLTNSIKQTYKKIPLIIN